MAQIERDDLPINSRKINLVNLFSHNTLIKKQKGYEIWLSLRRDQGRYQLNFVFQ